MVGWGIVLSESFGFKRISELHYITFLIMFSNVIFVYTFTFVTFAVARVYILMMLYNRMTICISALRQYNDLIYPVL